MRGVELNTGANRSECEGSRIGLFKFGQSSNMMTLMTPGKCLNGIASGADQR